MAGGMMGGGGKGGGGGAGGVSPNQMALAQYTYGQDALSNAAKFGGQGIGQSTMGTMADVGGLMGEAQQLGGMSQADTQAMNAYNQQQKAGLSSSIGGLGSLLGGGGGGGSGGIF